MAGSTRRFFTVLPKNYVAFFIRLPLLLVISIGAIVFFFQDFLLHHPDRMQADRVAAEARRHRLQLWPSGTAYRGLLSISEVQKPIGTFLVFHGNAGSAVDRKWYADRLAPLGFRVLLLEYPGYGPRSGGLSEDVLVADAQESIVAAAKQFGRPLYVMGESLGSGVAAAAVARSAPSWMVWSS